MSVTWNGKSVVPIDLTVHRGGDYCWCVWCHWRAGHCFWFWWCSDRAVVEKTSADLWHLRSYCKNKKPNVSCVCVIIHFCFCFSNFLLFLCERKFYDIEWVVYVFIARGPKCFIVLVFISWKTDRFIIMYLQSLYIVCKYRITLCEFNTIFVVPHAPELQYVTLFFTLIDWYYMFCVKQCMTYDIICFSILRSTCLILHSLILLLEYIFNTIFAIDSYVIR